MRLFGLVILMALGFSSMAQDYEAIIKGERSSFKSKQDLKFKRSGQPYNLTYHKIKLSINPLVYEISGSVYTELIPLEDNFTTFSFDLDVRMSVDSVIQNGNQLTFIHQSDEVLITVPQATKGSVLNVEVFYHGDPSVNERNGFSYDFQKDGPIAWTLSEPYGAYGWWPCKQQLEDKIDSIDLEIIVPKNNKAASLGLLEQVDTLPDSSLVYYWKHRYPVATYLVAVAVTNYYEESHYIHLSNGDSLYHLDYLYPAYKPAADILRRNIDGMMVLFDSLFGPYPFKNEKYGHAQFGRGGGMEHQTMSFMSDLDFDLMAHELAHQWYGNKLTCGSWKDLWLNEGFATYSNAIAREFLWSKQDFLDFLEVSRDKSISQPDGSVYAKDTSNVGVLFSGNIRYRKGAMVLHMLRWELGDEVFFNALRSYTAGQDVCYNFATTEIFKDYLEQENGDDLTDFFNQWVYNEGFPEIVTRWNRIGEGKIHLELNQTTSHASVDFFPLKIQYKATGETKDTIIEIDHNISSQAFDVEVGFKVVDLEFDPNIWLIAQSTVVEGSHIDVDEISLFPNPANDKVSLFVKDRKIDRVEVLDILGRKVVEQNVRNLKNSTLDLNISGIEGGTYFIKAYIGDESVLIKFIKTKH
jgi:aminopeptidase N